MAVINREEFRRARRARPDGSTLSGRVATQRGSQPELDAAAQRMRTTRFETLEGALAQAGIDVRQLRLTLGRNQKAALEAITALRSKSVPSSEASPVPATRFRTLQALAGRALPLDQPSSLYFLQEPFDFFAYQDANYLVDSSTALGDVWFSTKIFAGLDSQYGQYTFAYDWYNDSESSVLLSVSTALVFFGSLYGGAYGAGADTLWDARTECDIYATLKLSVGNDFDPEYRTSTIATFVIDTGLFGLGNPLGSQWFNHEDRGISMDSYLVAPNTGVEIDVTTSFSFFFGWANAPENFGYVDADFASAGGRISCPGVVLIATPVTTIF
jgi:hypothetical protein